MVTVANPTEIELSRLASVKFLAHHKPLPIKIKAE